MDGHQSDIFKWAIEHSDPEFLRQIAAATKGDDAPKETDGGKRRAELKPIEKKWIDALFPSEFVKMRDSLNDIQDTEKDLGTRLTALDDLEFLVEGVDNANDLDKLRGVKVLLELFANASEDDELRLGSGLVLLTAMGNNPVVQGQVLQYDGVALVRNVLTAAEKGKKSEFLHRSISIFSSLSNAHEAATRAILNDDEIVRTLQKLVNDEEEIGERVIKKMIFLFWNLSHVNPGLFFGRMGAKLLEKVGKIGEKFEDFREQCKEVVLKGIQGSPQFVEEVRRTVAVRGKEGKKP